MMRVTTNSVLRNYKNNLARSSLNVNSARNKVLTQRNFNSYAEDPAAATQAFQLRRSLWRTDSQISNSQAVVKKFESAYDILQNVSNKVDEITDDALLRALNDPTGTGRAPLGSVLTQTADSILQSMNSKYGSSFLFSGADGLNVPFSLDKDGKVLFRGIDVNAAEGTPEYEALQRMASEATYADLGLGMQENENGGIIPSSAFNTALSGLNYLGYGVDEKGESNNIICIMKDLGDILSRCKKDATEGDDKDSNGAWATPEDQERAQYLQQKLDNALSTLISKRSEQTTQADFLNTNQENLKLSFDNMNEQLLNIEQIDLADAITSFSWAQYCYNSALKVGNSILSQSLIDFMR